MLVQARFEPLAAPLSRLQQALQWSLYLDKTCTLTLGKRDSIFGLNVLWRWVLCLLRGAEPMKKGNLTPVDIAVYYWRSTEYFENHS